MGNADGDAREEELDSASKFTSGKAGLSMPKEAKEMGKRVTGKEAK